MGHVGEQILLNLFTMGTVFEILSKFKPFLWCIQSHDQISQLLRVHFSLDPATANTLISRIIERLELVYGGITCDDTTSRRRTFDGSCNNQLRPERGMVGLPLRRFALSAYSDGEDYVMSFLQKWNGWLRVLITFWMIFFPTGKKAPQKSTTGETYPVQERSPGMSQRTVSWLPMVMPPSWFILASF